MLFLIEWSIPSQNRVEYLNNFGNMTPTDNLHECGDSIQVLGRWHRLTGTSGVCVCSTEDVQALNSWMLNWPPICELTISPVIGDSIARESLRKKTYFKQHQQELIKQSIKEQIKQSIEEPIEKIIKEIIGEQQNSIEINLGQQVEIYSNNQESWLNGEIIEMDENENITIAYNVVGDHVYSKEVTSEDYDKIWKFL